MTGEPVLTRVPDADRPFDAKGTCYEVRIDGELVGIVYQTTRHWQRNVPGRRIIAQQGDAPAWGARSVDRDPLRRRDRLTWDTRGRAVRYLVTGS